MQTHIKSLTDEECDKLLGSTNLRWHKSLAVLMLDTGIRVGELVQLKVSDLWYLDSPAAMLDIRKDIAKNKQLRSIPVTSRLHEEIEFLHNHYWWLHRKPPTDYAFYGRDHGTPIGCRTVQRLIKFFGDHALHRRVTPHMLRHTFATRLMRKCSIRVVQQLLGHSSLQSTQIYTTPNHQDLQKAIDSLNERSEK